jgi:hypothetical protein
LVQDEARKGEAESRVALSAVAVGVLAVSSAAIFIRLADAPALAVAFWRNAFWRNALGVLVLLPLVLYWREAFPQGWPLFYGVASGAALRAHFGFLKWNDGDEIITTRDLLSRTVLYKVGHHGSHNATLAGAVDDVHPNLAWMGLGEFAGEFTAMIYVVNNWAVRVKPKPWYHPLPSIRRALLKKAQGRVLQMDIARPKKPESVPADAWAEFMTRVALDDLHFDYVIPDE